MFFPVSFMSKVYFPPDGLIHTPNREAGWGRAVTKWLRLSGPEKRLPNGKRARGRQPKGLTASNKLKCAADFHCARRKLGRRGSFGGAAGNLQPSLFRQQSLQRRLW